ERSVETGAQLIDDRMPIGCAGIEAGPAIDHFAPAVDYAEPALRCLNDPPSPVRIGPSRVAVGIHRVIMAEKAANEGAAGNIRAKMHLAVDPNEPGQACR